MSGKRYFVRMTSDLWDVLCGHVEGLIIRHEGSLTYAAEACGFSSRRLFDIRKRHPRFVELTTIERILLACEEYNDLDLFMPVPGKDGWSKMGHRFCDDCGDYDRQHHANGLCSLCYTYQRRNPGKLRSYQAK